MYKIPELGEAPDEKISLSEEDLDMSFDLLADPSIDTKTEKIKRYIDQVLAALKEEEEELLKKTHIIEFIEQELSGKQARLRK